MSARYGFARIVFAHAEIRFALHTIVFAANQALGPRLAGTVWTGGRGGGRDVQRLEVSGTAAAAAGVSLWRAICLLTFGLAVGFDRDSSRTDGESVSLVLFRDSVLSLRADDKAYIKLK
jgi:hypothetical protein